MHALHLDTPLLRAPPSLFGGKCREVWLKMDALQPSGSFKMRGVGRLVQQRVAEGARAVVCASGGNAGVAARRARFAVNAAAAAAARARPRGVVKTGIPAAARMCSTSGGEV